jgi:uncharacterized membrane protein YkvA (DUF1232 family)
MEENMKKAKIILTIIYLLSPIDIIPEAVLGPLGLLDDGGALLYLLATLFSEDEDKKIERRPNNNWNNYDAIDYNQNSNFVEETQASKGNNIISSLILIIIIGAGIYFFREKIPFIKDIIPRNKAVVITQQNKEFITNPPKIQNVEVESKDEIHIEPKSDIEIMVKNGKYLGSERNQFIVLDGKSVYVDENGNILE